MRFNNTKGTIGWTEENEEVALDFVIEYTFWPGEPMVRYTRNGDGYPGSPDSVELIDARCVLVTTETEERKPGDEEAKRLGAAFLDGLSDDLLRRVEEKCCTDLSHREEAARDSADEERFARMRGE